MEQAHNRTPKTLKQIKKVETPNNTLFPSGVY